MTGNRFYINGQRAAGQPARSWLGYLVMLPFLVVALVLGFFFFAVFLAIFSVVVVTLLVRFWWIRRSLRNGATPFRTHTVRREKDTALDGEYVVVVEEEKVVTKDR